MSKVCPTCGAECEDSHSFNLPVGHPDRGQWHRCPVCMGTGIVPLGTYSGTAGQFTFTTVPLTEQCRSCRGSGIVWG